MDEYIERDAVHDLVRSLTKYAWTSPNNTGHRVTVDADDVNFGVDKIPAADVAQVRHGRWVQVIVHVETDDGFVDRVEECCSACHEPNERRCTYFCPNCGAKMDGGAD